MSFEDALTTWWIWAALSGALLVAGIVLALLWRRAAVRLKRRDDGRIDAENQRIDAELRRVELADRLALMTEIHDAAAATITGIIQQAEGAKFVAESDPQAASRVASSIADQARGVLSDVRRVVNVGRSGSAETEKSASLGSLDDLFRSMNESGLVVSFEESGSPFAITSSAEIAIYRIVQEALNNSRQHGGTGASVKVAMTWSQNGLQLRVDDDGTRARNNLRDTVGDQAGYTIADDQRALVDMLDGRGMKDMRARAEAFGGVFSAHRTPGIGFSISAAFPTLRFHNGVHGVSVSSDGS